MFENINLLNSYFHKYLPVLISRASVNIEGSNSSTSSVATEGGGFLFDCNCGSGNAGRPARFLAMAEVMPNFSYNCQTIEFKECYLITNK